MRVVSRKFIHGAKKYILIGLIIIPAFIFGSAARLMATYDNETCFIYESPLSDSQKLDVIRFLQARIVQNPDDGYYLVRDARVLLRENSSLSTFAYLVTCQMDGSAEIYEIGDFYSVSGYYLVFLTREGEEFEIVDQFDITPPELLRRLGITSPPSQPEFADNPNEFDFSGPLFNAMDADVVAWQDEMVTMNVPRFEFLDLTNDGYLDCVLDIDGFEFQPTSYYVAVIETESGFLEGFRAWGYDTDVSEHPYLNENNDGMVAIGSSIYSVSELGNFLPFWKNYFIWNGERFVGANGYFAVEYESIVGPLEQLYEESLNAETDAESRWYGLPRYAINATRYSEGIGTPIEYCFNLAKIAEYQSDTNTAERWWGVIIDYLNDEYDSQELMNLGEIDPSIRDVVFAYEEMRDEIYAAAESSLSGD